MDCTVVAPQPCGPENVCMMSSVTEVGAVLKPEIVLEHSGGDVHVEDLKLLQQFR